MNKTCPKCNSEMVKGQLSIPGAIDGVRWEEHKEKKPWFTIIPKLPKYIVYTCKSCGFCENYVEDLKK